MASDIARPSDRIVYALAERRETILEVIRQATRELKLSLFRCNDKVIFAELGHASSRGVAIEVLITPRAKGGQERLRKLRKKLLKVGASVHVHSDPVVKYHAKYLVADDGPALVSSLNFTRKCFEQTFDAMVLTYDHAVVSSLRALLAADRDGRPTPTDLTPRLIVGPDRARQQLTALIDNAQSSIQLIDAKLWDPDIKARLNARRAEGLRVEVWTSSYIGELKSHGKIMLIDGRLAVIGSLALAAINLGFRREIALTVDEPAAVAQVTALLQSLSGQSTMAPLPTDEMAEPQTDEEADGEDEADDDPAA